MNNEAPNHKKLNIAVWGIGKHAKNKILPAIYACSNLNLFGIYSRNKDIINECSEKFSCKSWPTPEEMLEDKDLDIIYLASPIGLHVEQGKKILQAEKHFWCEKPVAPTYKDAKELIEISRHVNKTLFEGFMYMYHPQYKWLKNYVTQKELGSIWSISCRFGIPFLDEPGFRYNAKLGGSALLDVGCYPLSAVLDLTSHLKPVVSHSAIHYISGYEVDMHGYAILNFPDNATAILEWGMGRGYRNDIDIWGDNGSVYTDMIFSKTSDYKPEFVIRDLTGNKSKIVCEPDNHFISMFEYFANKINDKDFIEIEYDNILNRAYYLDEIIRTNEFLD